MFKRFIKYYRPHLRLFVLDMLASLIISLIGMLYPVLTRTMLGDLIPNQKFDFLILFGVVLLILYILRMLLRYFVQYYGHVIGVRMQAQMRSDMFKKLESLPYAYYDNHETGKIMSRMTNDLQDVSELAHHGPENIIICGIMVIGSFIYLLTINWELTLIIFMCIPILILISMKLKTKMSKAFMDSRKSVAKINAALENSITGIRVTKAFNNAEIEQEKFEVGNKEFVEARSQAYKSMGQFHSSTNFITDVFNVIVLIAGGIFLYNGEITFADYSTFIVSINLFINPITTMINFMEQYQSGVTGFARFLEIMDEKPEVEKENAIDLKEVKGKLTFDHVYFAYEESKEIINDISLTINPGEMVALVGPSGGGKTTLCHLLPNFYKVSGGRILIDDVDINDVTFTSLRRNIGIVQQDVFLFTGTFKENILYGNLNASEEEMIEAAKKARIHDYIVSLPHGYETEIGERGVKLSGGQKQRLSIARIFLKNPAILIFDEATSALDNTTEVLIQEALDELCKNRTTIVVAHRLSTIKNTSRIAVVSKGKIVEEGSHNELLKRNGIYKRLYLAQFKNDYLLDLNLE